MTKNVKLQRTRYMWINFKWTEWRGVPLHFEKLFALFKGSKCQMVQDFYLSSLHKFVFKKSRAFHSFFFLRVGGMCVPLTPVAQWLHNTTYYIVVLHIVCALQVPLIAPQSPEHSARETHGQAAVPFSFQQEWIHKMPVNTCHYAVVTIGEI